MAAYDRSAALYDAIYRGIGKDYGAESATIIGLVQAKCPGARTLLDVACGTGGHLERWPGPSSPGSPATRATCGPSTWAGATTS